MKYIISTLGCKVNQYETQAMEGFLSEKGFERAAPGEIADAVIVNTCAVTAAPHILSVSLPGFRSEVLMNFLEAREIYVSRSSACKKGARSHVLESIGMEPRLIDGALRIGLCRYNTGEDVAALIGGLRDAYQTLAHR